MLVTDIRDTLLVTKLRFRLQISLRPIRRLFMCNISYVILMTMAQSVSNKLPLFDQTSYHQFFFKCSLSHHAEIDGPTKDDHHRGENLQPREILSFSWSSLPPSARSRSYSILLFSSLSCRAMNPPRKYAKLCRMQKWEK